MNLEKSINELVISRWPEQWVETPKVNPQYNRVRRISETHVVKFPEICESKDIFQWYKSSEERCLESLQEVCKEFETHLLAFNLGLSVPKPEGIFEVFLRENYRSVNIPGLVMEYIPGITVYELFTSNHPDIFNAELQRNEELEKFEKLGFYDWDADNDLNAIWNPEKRKIYLIDFQYCEVRK